VFQPFLAKSEEVGRQENLTTDLRRILERGGEKVVPEVLEQMVAKVERLSIELADARAIQIKL
jgi:hypothetical protein